jgi:hypothetical protein
MLAPQFTTRSAPTFAPVPMDRVDSPDAGPTTDWLWHGLIARGNLTLLTSQWKAGKTTLITGLLQQFGSGGTFLDRPIAPAKVLVVSEESRQTWADRLRRMLVGGHCQLLSRPFARRPTPGEWNALVDHALELHAAGRLDLLVIDPLAKFLPGTTESDLNALLHMLDPLQKLTEAGAGVTILHHPRKKKSDEGSSARGSGGLLAAVDIIVELTGIGPLRTDERRRKLFAMSRYPETPRRLVYEWDPTTGRFASQADPVAARFHENWDHLHAILAKRKRAATHQELLMDWPPELERPAVATLYEWLNRAFEEKRLRRTGSGRKGDPYLYRLENEDDAYWDRGEVPPLRDLEF